MGFVSSSERIHLDFGRIQQQGSLRTAWWSNSSIIIGLTISGALFIAQQIVNARQSGYPMRKSIAGNDRTAKELEKASKIHVVPRSSLA